MFCEPEGLPTWSSIELMAQTISAYAGYKGQTQGLPPKIGFLLGKRVKCSCLVLILVWAQPCGIQ